MFPEETWKIVRSREEVHRDQIPPNEPSSDCSGTQRPDPKEFSIGVGVCR